MGLITSIGSKIFNYGAKAINYGKRAVKVAPDIIFGKGADVFVHSAGQAAREAVKGNKSWVSSIWSGIKTGGKAVEASVATNVAKNGSFLTQAWKAIKSIPSTLATTTKAGARAAKIAGKSSVLGGVKGFFKGVGKKMPLIGNLMLVAFELPNIFKATKEEGVGQGVAEVAKAGGRLAGGALGSAIGSAICPGIGSVVGWIAGEWLASKVVGKSYTEQQEELAQKQQEAIAMAEQMGMVPAQNPQTGYPQDAGTQEFNPNAIDPQNPYGNSPATNPFVPYQSPYDMMNGGYYNNGFNNPYADDIMMNNLKLNMMG